MRTPLEEAKIFRGGLCVDCGASIMDESQLDHTFCNYCWWVNLKHPFYSDEDNLCGICGDSKDGPANGNPNNGNMHSPYFTGVDVPGYNRET